MQNRAGNGSPKYLVIKEFCHLIEIRAYWRALAGRAESAAVRAWAIAVIRRIQRNWIDSTALPESPLRRDRLGLVTAAP